MKKMIITVMMVLSSIIVMGQSQANRGNVRPHDRQEIHDGRHRDHSKIVYVATQEQVDDIVQYVKSKSFDDDKLGISKLCVRLLPIPTEGIGCIAKQFTFDKNKLDFIKYAYAYCPDPEMYYILRDLFTFKTDVDKLFDELGVKGPRFND